MNPVYAMALVASVLFGGADYSGGLAARKSPALWVTWISGFAAIAVLAVAMLFVHGAPGRSDLAWGVAAGLAGAIGGTLIYHALALGPVSVASPVFSVVGLTLPVLFGVTFGERPGALAWTGVALAVVAIPLLSWSGAGDTEQARARVRKTVAISIVTGIAIGGFLICISRVHRSAGLLPLLVARVAAILALSIQFVRRRAAAPAPAGAPAQTLVAGAPIQALVAGALDAGGNALFMFAAQQGSLAISSALVSLAPATSVMLARFHLHERWNAVQAAGLVAALAAGACLSLG